MAINPNGPASEGMYQAVKDAEGVFGSTNKANISGGLNSLETKDEYELSMSDDELIDLVSDWKSSYANYYKDIEASQEKAFKYWIGKQTENDLTVMSSNSDPNPLVDNVIFTALETFLPLATRANPDPIVSTNQEAEQVGHAIHAGLIYEADRQKLRRKLARLVRTWAWNRIGVVQLYWDHNLKRICTEVINGKMMIFDVDGYVDEGGRFRGSHFGHKKREYASRLIEMFPKKKSDIERIAKGKMATKLTYISWWYHDTDNFYTLEQAGRESIILGKYKNPNWNYDIPEQEAQEAVTDEQSGVVVQEAKNYKAEQEGINFFDEPKSPYIFFSVFSSGTKPHDETSLILQNISLQDVVNKTLRQIDFNVKSMNLSLVVSGKSFTDDQAANAANAMMQGKAILVPDGNVDQGAKRMPPPALPQTVFEHRNDSRNELMNVFGVAGSTPDASAEQKTVRGKIMTQQQDTSRIGGTITEQLEQVADAIYQYWVQMFFVFYDDEHFISTAGQQGGTEIISIKNSMFPLIKTLDVTVKEGSLIPKDPLTQRNEAMDLWSANAIDPLNFYKRLDVADPKSATEQLILWQMVQKGAPPNVYLPDFQNPMGTPLPGQQPGTGGPAVNNLDKPNEVTQTPTPASQPAVEQQMSQLIKSVPEPKI